jgi:hypothetical protein
MKKTCVKCSKNFNGRKERNYCSQRCAWDSQIGRQPIITEVGRLKLSQYAKNRTPEHRAKLGVSHKGENA